MSKIKEGKESELENNIAAFKNLVTYQNIKEHLKQYSETRWEVNEKERIALFYEVNPIVNSDGDFVYGSDSMTDEEIQSPAQEYIIDNDLGDNLVRELNNICYWGLEQAKFNNKEKYNDFLEIASEMIDKKIETATLEEKFNIDSFAVSLTQEGIRECGFDFEYARGFSEIDQKENIEQEEKKKSVKKKNRSR